MRLCFLLCLLSILPLSSFGAVPACGEHPTEDQSLTWTKVATIKIDIIIDHINAILCIGANKNDALDVEKVSYRDDWGLEKVYSFADLTKGPMVLLTDRDINIGVIRKGKVMTMRMTPVRKQNDELFYDIELRFLRNLAKLPTSRDHRKLVVSVEQNSQGDLSSYYETADDEFNHIDIYIATTLSIHQIDLKDFNIIRNSIKTKSLPEIDEL